MQNRICLAALLLSVVSMQAYGLAQSRDAGAPETVEQKIDRLSAAAGQLHAQMEASQRQMIEIEQQLAALRLQVAAEKAGLGASSSQAAAAGDAQREANNLDGKGDATSSLDEIREQQAIDESEIATHEQTKLETQSKYPLKVTGLILFNGFVNTRQVDTPAAPAYALAGPGSTGFSMRQTVLGIDGRGPQLFGGKSYADVRVDFFGGATGSNYPSAGLLRLRTAHAGIQWRNSEGFVEFDRSLLAPNAPASLVALAEPELAWAGNLWTWNPQVGASWQIWLSDSTRLKVQAALIDAADPASPAAAASTVGLAERSRWPGSEARISLTKESDGLGAEAGVGGYFSPHRTPDGSRFNAWAGTIDLRAPIGRQMELTANAYRGQALGDLGGGGYSDYVYRYSGWAGKARALDDIGGWAQMKWKAGRRVELNLGYGIDNPFAKEVHASEALPGNNAYTGLARNRSYYGNAIYSPTPYLIFSVETRRVWTDFATGPAAYSDIVGLGAGYRF